MEISFQLVGSSHSFACLQHYWQPYFEHEFSAMPADMAKQLAMIQVNAKAQEYYVRWPNLHVFQLLHQGEKIGCILIAFDQDTLQIVDFIIVDKFRNQGFAKATLEAVILLAQKENISNIRLAVANGNHAINLYHSLGFKTADSSASHKLMELNTAVSA